VFSRTRGSSELGRGQTEPKRPPEKAQHNAKGWVTLVAHKRIQPARFKRRRKLSFLELASDLSNVSRLPSLYS
jgi:transcription initiation factor TFIID subunit TAF12